MMTTNAAEIAGILDGTLVDGLVAARDGALQGAIGAAMVDRSASVIDEMFATRTAPSGAAWVAPARDYGHPLLRASGDLAGSGKAHVGPRNDQSGLDITFDFTDEKAPWHHFGTKRGGAVKTKGSKYTTRRKSGGAERQHVPARPLLPASGEEGRWVKALEAAGQAAADKWLTANVSI